MTQTMQRVWGLILTGFLVVGFTIMPAVAGAAEFKTGEQTNFPFGETIQDDLYMAGATVSSAGTILGDGLFAGGNVLLSGPIAGDAAAGGGTVTVLADVSGDLRLAGGTVVIQSGVGEDLLVAGGQLTIAGPGIGGEAVIAGGQVTITAPIAGKARIYAGEVFIDSVIGGDVEIHADKVTLGENAVLGGYFAYSAPQEATIADGAVIAGETVYSEVKASGEKVDKAGIAAFFAVLVGGLLLAKFFMLLLGALLLGFLLKRFAKEVVTRSAANPLNQLVRGGIWTIVLPVVSVFLLITVIGIPLGILGFLAFSGVMILANFAAAIVTGSVVHKWIAKPAEYEVNWKTIILGVVIYGIVLTFIPFIGWLAKLAILLIALGAMWSIKSEALKDWQ